MTKLTPARHFDDDTIIFFAARYRQEDLERMRDITRYRRKRSHYAQLLPGV